MTKKTRREIDAVPKAKIALEAIREQVMVAELAQRYQIHSYQATKILTHFRRPTPQERRASALASSQDFCLLVSNRIYVWKTQLVKQASRADRGRDAHF